MPSGSLFTLSLHCLFFPSALNMLKSNNFKMKTFSQPYIHPDLPCFFIMKILDRITFTFCLLMHFFTANYLQDLPDSPVTSVPLNLKGTVWFFIFFYFSTAFDIDNHSFLPKALSYFGFYDTTLSLFFLQLFCFEGLSSPACPLNINVLHDSIIETVPIIYYCRTNNPQT